MATPATAEEMGTPGNTNIHVISIESHSYTEKRNRGNTESKLTLMLNGVKHDKSGYFKFWSREENINNSPRI